MNPLVEKLLLPNLLLSVKLTFARKNYITTLDILKLHSSKIALPIFVFKTFQFFEKIADVWRILPNGIHFSDQCFNFTWTNFQNVHIYALYYASNIYFLKNYGPACNRLNTLDNQNSILPCFGPGFGSLNKFVVAQTLGVVNADYIIKTKLNGTLKVFSVTE